MQKTLQLIIVVVFLFAFPHLSFSQSQISTTPSDSNATPADIYIIGSGDILEIVTWKEPDFSRKEIVVRLDGNISFPLLDDIVAAGRTPTQLKFEIQNRLIDFVAEPNVTVTVREAASKKFYILGEVTNTGEYPLTKKLTVLQAFAIAGGFTEWASKKEILVFRNENGQEKVIRVNYKKIVKGEDADLNVMLEADDTIVVP
jgi:polysaccharide biosynthesis/export protein